ncbi:MAG: ABC-F family ATP-binding cassette domain-containing protein [Paludibacteraceae bacterium]|nr:ABC-F family ATP-binding cassette domain-containing protein [Paludibacteraceae bacterium]
MSQPYVQINGLSKSFGDKQLFDDVSFGIAEGQRIALVARNGLGKSTLLSIIAGAGEPDAGTVVFRNDLRVGYLPQLPPYDPEATVAQVCNRHESEMNFRQYLTRLDIRDLNQTMATLSGGQRKRVALANVLAQQPDLLILDEPTNHLDLRMVEWLEDYLRRPGITLLMVTHDRYFLDNVCSDIIELDDRRLYTYHGNYAYYLDKRAARIDVRNAETERARNLYRTELDWMRRMPQARAHKAQYRIDNFYQLEQRAKQRIVEDTVRLENKNVYIGSKIFEAKHVSKAFEDRVILRDFSYVFSRYEKMGIIGANGTGKSTFLRLLLGEVKPDAGHFDIGTTIRFGYYSQTGLALPEGKKVLDVVRDVAEVIDLGSGRKLTASQFLQHFLFSPSQQHDYVDKLSGGERQRLHLCRVLMDNPNFLILDEPTNDLDIPTLNVLEQYLREFHGCLIVVSHDRYFMDKVVDHLLVFNGNGDITDFPGNYTQYRLERDSNPSPAADKPAAPAASKPRLNEQARPRRLTFKEQQELLQLEQEMPRLEQEKAELEAQLSGLLTDPDAIAAASLRHQQVTARLDDAEMRWLALSDI